MPDPDLSKLIGSTIASNLAPFTRGLWAVFCAVIVGTIAVVGFVNGVHSELNSVRAKAEENREAISIIKHGIENHGIDIATLKERTARYQN